MYPFHTKTTVSAKRYPIIWSSLYVLKITKVIRGTDTEFSTKKNYQGFYEEFFFQKKSI